MKDLIAKLLAILNTADQGTFVSKAWNILLSIIVAAATIVTLACKLELPVPGLDCKAVEAPTET